MAEYRWPIEVLRARDINFNLNERTLGTQPSVSGYTQVVSGGPPIWTATYAAIDIRTQQQRLLWRAFSTLLRGRQNTVLVPMCRGDQPVPSGYIDEDITYSDDTVHYDDTPYTQAAISASVGALRLAGADSIFINSMAIGALQGGQYFSIANKLYQILTVSGGAGGDYTLGIWPPLRSAIYPGNKIEFDNPTCRMRLATDQEMALDLQSRRFASPTVRFIEDFS